MHLLFIHHTGQGIENCFYRLFTIQGRENSTASTVYSAYRAENTAYNVLYTEYRAGNTELYFALYSPYNAQYSTHCAVLYTEYRAGNTELHSALFSPYNIPNTLCCIQILQNTGQEMLYLKNTRQEIQSQVYYNTYSAKCIL